MAPATISVCGSDATAALFSSSQRIRTLLATSWGLGLSNSNFTSSLTGMPRLLPCTQFSSLVSNCVSESSADLQHVWTRDAIQNPNSTWAGPGIELFSNGTCDVLVTASPLSESQAAPLTRHAPARHCAEFLYTISDVISSLMMRDMLWSIYGPGFSWLGDSSSEQAS